MRRCLLTEPASGGGHVQSLVGWFPVVRGHGPRPHVACDRGCAWAGGASVMFHCLSSVCGSLMTTNPIGTPVLVAMDSLDALRVYFKPDPVRYGYTMSLDYLMLSDGNVYCLVCGYLPSDPPWRLSGRSPSFEVCPCCGVEWGYEDSSPASVVCYRGRWLADGAAWQDKRTPNDGLDVEARLTRIIRGQEQRR